MRRPEQRLVPRPVSLAAAAALLLLATASPAAAQLGRKSWEFFPQAGFFLPAEPDFAAGATGYDGGVLYGFAATYHYTDHVGVEWGFAKAGADADACEEGCPTVPGNHGPDVGFTMWRLSGFANSGALDRLQAFATAGVGLVSLDPDAGEGATRLLLEGGVGVRYYAWKSIALRLDVKDFVFTDVAPADYGDPRAAEDDVVRKETLHNVGAAAGLSFNF